MAVRGIFLFNYFQIGQHVVLLHIQIDYKAKLVRFFWRDQWSKTKMYYNNSLCQVRRNWWLARHIKTKSIRKSSNFNFRWTKTLYQNNLNNIAFFFTFFKGERIFVMRAREKKISNFKKWHLSIGNSMVCSDIWHKSRIPLPFFPSSLSPIPYPYPFRRLLRRLA